MFSTFPVRMERDRFHLTATQFHFPFRSLCCARSRNLKLHKLYLLSLKILKRSPVCFCFLPLTNLQRLAEWEQPAGENSRKKEFFSPRYIIGKFLKCYWLSRLSSAAKSWWKSRVFILKPLNQGFVNISSYVDTKQSLQRDSSALEDNNEGERISLLSLGNILRLNINAKRGKKIK